MDIIKDFAQQNPEISILLAIIVITIAGFLIRKLKFIAFIMILVASYFLFFLFFKGEVDIPRFQDIKKEVKKKIMRNI